MLTTTLWDRYHHYSPFYSQGNQDTERISNLSKMHSSEMAELRFRPKQAGLPHVPSSSIMLFCWTVISVGVSGFRWRFYKVHSGHRVQNGLGVGKVEGTQEEETEVSKAISKAATEAWEVEALCSESRCLGPEVSDLIVCDSMKTMSVLLVSIWGWFLLIKRLT